MKKEQITRKDCHEKLKRDRDKPQSRFKAVCVVDVIAAGFDVRHAL